METDQQNENNEEKNKNNESKKDNLDQKIKMQEQTKRESELKSRNIVYNFEDNFSKRLKPLIKSNISLKDIIIEYYNESRNAESEDSRLRYNNCIFYLLLFLNIFLPGIGTIIAGIGWGNTCKLRNRKKELINRGKVQLLTFILIFGWIQAIKDAITYFEINNCCEFNNYLINT